MLSSPFRRRHHRRRRRCVTHTCSYFCIHTRASRVSLSQDNVCKRRTKSSDDETLLTRAFNYYLSWKKQTRTPS